MATLYDNESRRPSLIISSLTSSRVGTALGEHDLLVVITVSISVIAVSLSSGSNRSCYIAHVYAFLIITRQKHQQGIVFLHTSEKCTLYSEYIMGWAGCH